ncbi:hypothetical protein U879_01215 [Defluviimonas sp. 20V17]|uniref:Nitric oxide dioxygenase n=1 Tax=Allgaiera indica TaxID=765699 RepID=A0AAN4UTS4_9RHOB|nr:globin domain-containing protein [Allgaiera indica]KDB05503.1 hypothetical protein U879_01215 [Defluviimonas sp. 20V17]GHE04729.1 hypothetical protein GCM10008024_32940 [Allgaiera indica]SDX46592.1 nitric oxide dioxygenase [Allgaiera indica]
MSLTAREAALVRASFRSVRDRVEPASRDFYAALFRRRPDLRGLFRGDLEGQGMKFMSTLQVVVDTLEAPEATAGRLHDLGRSHAALGVRPAHFEPMREALFEVLAGYLGGGWDAETRGAWHRAYDQMVERMIAARPAR